MKTIQKQCAGTYDTHLKTAWNTCENPIHVQNQISVNIYVLLIFIVISYFCYTLGYGAQAGPQNGGRPHPPWGLRLGSRTET